MLASLCIPALSTPHEGIFEDISIEIYDELCMVTFYISIKRPLEATIAAMAMN